MLLLLQLLLLNIIKFAASFNESPSLMTSNAVMAVVIEKPFFESTIMRKKDGSRRDYERNLERFTKMIKNAANERITDTGAAIEMSVVHDATNINLGNDYTALLSIANCDETWNLYTRAREEELVHLAITDSDCPRLPIAHGISVPIVKPGEELAQIFLDLRMARVFDWKRINLVHDRAFESDTIGRVLRSLSGEIPNNSHLGLATELLTSAHPVDSALSTNRSIAETLKKFQQRNNGNFLVIVNSDIMPLIAQVARSMGMLHPETRWLYVLPNMNSSNPTVFNRLLGEGENVAFIYNDTNRECRQGVECHAKEMVGALGGAVQNILRQEVELYERVTEEEFDAVRTTKPERRRQIIGYIRAELHKDREERCNVCGECVTWKMMAGITWGNSFVGENKAEPHRLINVGYWTPGSGAFPKDLLFPHSKHGFRMKLLPIVTYHNPPWQYITESKNNGKLKWDGIVFDIVDQLSRNLNFTYRLIVIDVPPRGMLHLKSEASDNRFGGTVEQKEFVRTITSSGEKMPEAVRELVAGGKVLMAACAHTVTEHLESSINFTLPISIETYGLLASRPKQLSRVMLFSSPYTNESWACLAGGILLIGPILYLVHKYSPTRTDDGPSLNTGLGSPARCLWYIYGALLQQGGMHLPKNDGARLIVGTWWLVVMILVATYSGSLVAFLTFPRMQDKISSIEDLLKHEEELGWSLPSRSFLEEYITNGKSDKYDGLSGIGARRRAERHNSSNYARIVVRVREGKHVLVDWMSSLRKLMRADNPITNDGVCHFSIGTETFIEESIALFVPPNSAYLRLINNELKKMHESGLIGKWTSDRMTMKDECWEESGMNRRVDNHKVDVWDMQGIFFVLVLGYLVAFCFLIWEFYTHHRKLSKERNLIRPFVS